MSMIDLHPTVCNLCGGKVVYTNNKSIYHGKSYGSGFCYLCLNCGAHVGTHRPRPKEALGILANDQMRKGKMYCHSLFDPMWKTGTRNRSGKRKRLYAWLADQMQIPVNECHFGYFDIDQLRKAYRILLSVQNKKLTYKSSGEIYFE